jgi:hypothetical protein
MKPDHFIISRIIIYISVCFLLQCSLSCSEIQEHKVSTNDTDEIQLFNDTLVKLTELESCDILVKPNINWLPGTAMVSGGSGFGHAVLVIDGGKDTNTINLLQKINIFESQARMVPNDYELRMVNGYKEGNDFRFANTNFGNQNEGFRYRLRFHLSQDEKDSILKFVFDQDPDLSSWRSLKRLKINNDSLNSSVNMDKNIWYCSLLIWEAFYKVLGVDLDVNGGLMVFPNDLIASPYFDGRINGQKKRVRF